MGAKALWGKWIIDQDFDVGGKREQGQGHRETGTTPKGPQKCNIQYVLNTNKSFAISFPEKNLKRLQ